MHPQLVIIIVTADLLVHDVDARASTVVAPFKSCMSDHVRVSESE
jgi:hypothetical protein